MTADTTFLGDTRARAQALLARYDRSGPRYTSYPTAPVWTAEHDAAAHGERLAAAGRRPDEPVSLYVHVPFCTSMCWYCACSVIITQRAEKGARYVDRLLREADLVREAMGSARPVVQHHWGGGTPTFLEPEQLARLAAGLHARFPLADDAEVSVEVDPRVTTRAHLEALAANGFNRISFGVQDLDREVQEAIHRVQSLEQTTALVGHARDLGFRSVNLDLVYGLPHQTVERFGRTIDAILELEPDRIACYGYAHVPWLKKHQAVMPEEALPDAATRLDLYCTALERFTAGGLDPVGMDHFAAHDDELAVAARTGGLHRNFMGYTTAPAEEMLAFGVTAIGEVDGAFAQNVKDLAAWEAALDAGRLPVERGLHRSADDEARRRIILDLMCRFRLRFADHGEDFEDRHAEALAELQPMVDDGLVVRDAAGLTVTPLGQLLVRNVAMAFDAYLPRGETAGAGPRFSRTV